MSQTTPQCEIVAPCELSLIIPAYNEAERLPSYLHSVRSYFDKTLPLRYEVIAVDDGSDDNTRSVVQAHASDWAELRYITHCRNSGKGSAMRTGAVGAIGNLFLFTDADGATPIEYESALREAVYHGADVATGIRCARDLVSRRPIRRVLSAAFHSASKCLLGTAHGDSQCGFKMMTRRVARKLFSLAREQGFLIDLELITVATRLGLRIVEVPVAFRDVPGSKVNLVRDSWRMLLGLSRLRRIIRGPCYESTQVQMLANPWES